MKLSITRILDRLKLEKQEKPCPRRGEGGFASYIPGPDFWRPGGRGWLGPWGRVEWIRKFVKRLRGRYSGPWAEYLRPLWPGPGKAPRTCSYCGGAHPDDVLELIRRGWLLDPTKAYKAYLEPPGKPTLSEIFERCTRRPHRPLTKAMIDELVARFGSDGRRWEPPGPPVKVYWRHWSREQITAVQAELRRALRS